MFDLDMILLNISLSLYAILRRSVIFDLIIISLKAKLIILSSVQNSTSLKKNLINVSSIIGKSLRKASNLFKNSLGYYLAIANNSINDCSAS